MSKPDYEEASRRSKEKLPWIRAGIEKHWGGSRRQAVERFRRWARRAEAELPAGFLNTVSFKMATALDQASGAGNENLAEYMRERETEKKLQ
jgi:hypothetical protein